MTGQELKEWRKTRGFTQPDLAELLRVSVNTIWQWENGKGRRFPPYLPLALAYIDENRGKIGKPVVDTKKS